MQEHQFFNFITFSSQLAVELGTFQSSSGYVFLLCLTILYNIYLRGILNFLALDICELSEFMQMDAHNSRGSL